MKTKGILLIAAAAMLTVSCSNDVVMSELNRDVISVRATLGKMSKGVLVTSANLGQFSIYASHYDATSQQDTAVIPQCTANVNSDGITSGYGQHYWPQDGGANQVKFYAWGPTDSKNGGQIVATSNTTFTVTPNDEMDTQVDFVYANTQKDQNTGKNGVNLMFRHAMSQVVVKVRNTQAQYKFNVRGWKIVYLDKDGTFTFSGSSTDNGTLSKTYWSDNTTASVNNSYSKTLANSLAITVADTVVLESNAIVVPQEVEKATKYTAAQIGAPFNGAYIAVLMNIEDVNGSVIKAEQWCCWPVKFDWEPGYKYIYSVDLSTGGYEETNPSDVTDDPAPVMNWITINPVLDNWIDVDKEVVM